MDRGQGQDGSAGTDAPVSPGDVLAGKYRVDRVLGVGGMGVVVAATHIDLHEQRAIKFMLPSHIGDDEGVQRFLQEARASAHLKGEHVAKVHDVGRLENGAPYMIMECLTGSDLGVEIERRGALPVHEAALYVIQACEALAEAHAAGIVHRDVKPENLFLSVGPGGIPSIKVLDFGISAILGSERELRMTKTSAIMGSPFYMSPEQTRSTRDVDTRTDVWSLGVILYQLVTGVLPFRGTNLSSIVTAVLFGTIVRPSERVHGLPEELDRIILRCLERDLDRRYPTVADLAEDLAPFAPAASSRTVHRIARMLPRPHPPLRVEDSVSAGTVSGEAGESGAFRVARPPRSRSGRRKPAQMIAVGAALSLSIGGAAFFLGLSAVRLAAGSYDPSTPARGPSVSASSAPSPPASAPLVMPDPAVPPASSPAVAPSAEASAAVAPSAETSAAVTPPPSSAWLAPSARRPGEPAGKGPPRPGSKGASKQPTAGDPFGDGRQ